LNPPATTGLHARADDDALGPPMHEDAALAASLDTGANVRSGVELILEGMLASMQSLLTAMLPPPAVSIALDGADMQVFDARAQADAKLPDPQRDDASDDASGDDPTEGDPIRFRILVQDGAADDPAAFALAVAITLADRRGWAAAGRPFRLGRGRRGTIDIILAHPSTTDRLCAPLRTGSVYSCGRGRRAVINVERWRHGAVAYTGSLADYRTYVINHEVGHLLAMPHLPCPRRGAQAPVMQQQSKSLAGCSATTHPSELELRRLRRRGRWRHAAGATDETPQ
jgi:hypothetical protein